MPNRSASRFFLIAGIAITGLSRLARAGEDQVQAPPDPVVLDEQATQQINTVMIDSLRPFFELVSTNPWIQGAIVIAVTLTCASLLSWLIFRIITAATRRTSLLVDNEIAGRQGQGS